MSLCAWCRTRPATSRDHLFPRSIGGTLELSLLSCKPCQDVISVAETELSRRSSYGFHLVNGGIAGRDKRKPRSGVIETKYVLVKHPQGGYNEVFFRAGDEIPESLPFIEINVNDAKPQYRIRALDQNRFKTLVDCCHTRFRQPADPTGFVFEIDVKTDDLKAIAEDSDFWPRIVLAPGERLYIRARNKDEALAFLKIFHVALNAGEFDKTYPGWTQTMIEGGTSHTALIAYDYILTNRVILKIACGLVLLAVGEANWTDETLADARNAILGNDDELVRRIVVNETMPDGVARFGEMHAAAVMDSPDGLEVCVSLFGSFERVTLPHDPRLAVSKGAACVSRHDGQRTKLLAGNEAAELVHKFATFDVKDGLQFAAHATPAQ